MKHSYTIYDTLLYIYNTVWYDTLQHKNMVEINETMISKILCAKSENVYTNKNDV